MNNSGQLCYLRFRGRVSGPFPFSRIKEMAAGGLVSPIHEISIDRNKWNPAGEIDDLFPTKSPDVELLKISSEDTTRERWYYIDANSQRIGPLERAELISQFDSGTIGFETVVWRSGMESWLSLADAGLVNAKLHNRQVAQQNTVQPAESSVSTTSISTHSIVPLPGIGKGIASMVMGILSIVFSCVSFFPYLILFFAPVQIVLGTLAIVFGGVAMKTKGRPFAITGLVCGIVGVSLMLMIVIVIVSIIGFAQVARTRW